MTATQQQDLQLQRRLQQDSIQLGGRTIYLNPFLYWRRFDSNTDRWLREPGQLTEDQITANRCRFYPEVDWSQLDDQQTAVRDGAVEMFLKSLELISTFHPELGSGQLLEVERKMTITKKRAFERWVDKALRRRSREETREHRRFERTRFWRAWREWIVLDTTQKALVPMVMLMVLCGFAGWSMGSASPPARHFRCRQDRLESVESGPMADEPAAPNPLDQLRLTLMQEVLPVGLAMVERAREGGPGRVAEVFTAGAADPLGELRQEGEPAARSLRDQLDQVSPGLGNPVMPVKVSVQDPDTAEMDQQ